MALPPTYVEGFHDKESVLQMEYNDLGKTGLKVSKLSFGCGPLGGALLYGEYSEEDAINAVREAIRKGINYVDTAPAYGQGNSERVLGKVHDIEFGPLEPILKESLPAAAKLIKQNKARHLGISAYPVSIMKEAIEKSSVPIELILSYSRDLIFDKTLQEYIPFFQSRGIGIVNAALTGMGILTKNGPSDWHPADPNLKVLCKKAAEYAEKKGVELSKLSVGYSLQQPGSHTYLVGMNSTAVLKKNMAMLKGLSQEEQTILEEIKQIFFNTNENIHWEGNEVSQYNKYVNSIKSS